MLNTNKRNNYLNWAKYFYAISNSAHSYYLNLYITYQEIISKSKDILKVSISEKQFLDELAEILQETESLVNEIDSMELTTKIFPQLEDLKTSLKIISCFKRRDKDTLSFLFSIIDDDVFLERTNVQLAKIVLAYNLESYIFKV